MAFLLSRGIHQIYHQDEYRWVVLTYQPGGEKIDVQPPMYLLLLKTAGRLFGTANLRILSALLALVNLFLIYLVSKKITGNKSIALLACFLFSFNAYSLIAGLQIDIDGALLPFFVLTAYYSYLKLADNKKLWAPVLMLTLVGGFLSKISFVIFFCSLILDYYFSHKEERDFKLKKIILLASGGVILFGILAALFYLVDSERFLNVLSYARGRAFDNFNFASRAYLDLIFKIMKSFVLLSPMLLLPVFYTLFKSDLRKKYRFWLIYLFFSFLFYAVIFNFSTLTIEKYFTFMIVPSVIISAEVLYPFFADLRNRHIYKPIIFTSIAVLAVTYIILSASHVTLPLNPKIAYFEHFRSFNLAFLIPFTGGSGPIGFYFSAEFIFYFWFFITMAFTGYYFWPKRQYFFLTFAVIAGLIYIVLFTNEFLWGRLNGSVPNVARETVEYVNNNPRIGTEQVITYYDIAPYDLRLSGKYYSRFYTAPNRDYTEKVTKFRGYYMIVNFPEIGDDNRYWKLIERCPVLKEFNDKKIRSYVFNCTNLK
jgi:hypothetical protein